MPITINGSGTITGISAGGLPDGSVTAADIESSLDLTGKTVTLPSGTGGKILQVVSASKTDQQSFTSSTATDITGLSVSITPSSTNSKILVFGYVEGAWQFNTAKMGILVVRGTTEIIKGDADGVKRRLTSSVYMAQENYSPFSLPFNYLDSPSSTSALTYKIQAVNLDNTGTVYVNRGYSSDNLSYNPVTASTITAMEVAG